MKTILLRLLCFIFFFSCVVQSADLSQSILLTGDWKVQLNPPQNGIPWDSSAPSQTIQLPGSIQSQGLGNDISVETKWVGAIADKSWYESPLYEKFRQKENPKIPFWFQAPKHYIGSVSYQREFNIPKGWAGKKYILTLERVHISSSVWVDGKEVGGENSLSTPHKFVLGQLREGPHQLLIRIDNQPIDNIGENSHCVSDHMQTNWNGIVGDIRIDVAPPSTIDDLQVYPDLPGRKVRVTWKCSNIAGQEKIALRVVSPTKEIFSASAKASDGETVIPLGKQVTPWDEFSPKTYKLEAKLAGANNTEHFEKTTFGMVDYRIDGKHFIVNGRRTIFRGTLDCAMFPMTGYPSTDVAYWKKVFNVVKSHGLNHVRFHSWCPPEAAFIAADEIGCYLLIEHAWTHPEKAGPYLMREAERVIETYGNHPSFAMHSYGNEPAESKEWMENFAKHFRKIDPRRYYAGSIGWPMLENNQFHSQMEGLRVYRWGAGLKSHINAESPHTMSDFGATTKSDNKPFISHETGQWCVYPDFSEISKYTGFLKAKNFEIFQEFLMNNHMADQAKDFLMATGRLQTICYKYEIEKLLRTPDIGGYQLLGLNDFPGQGTALVGCVNPLWETKPYTSPKEYTQFSGPTVPLVRLPRFVYKNNESLLADLEITHSGKDPLTKAVPKWKIVSQDNKVLESGALPARNIPIGQSSLGKIEIPLSKLPSPSQVKLVVEIDNEVITNSWDLWIYPSVQPKQSSEKVIITHHSDEALEKAKSGATVLLIPSPTSIVKPKGPKVAFGFSTIFWNTAWTKRQPPTTMGLLCNPKHPAFSGFPTDYHSNYQWWYPTQLVANPLSLEGQVPEMKALVQVIDDWFTARRLGLIVEAGFGKGKMIICAIDFDKANPDDMVSAQLRSSLISYMESPAFSPQLSMTQDQFNRMIDPNILVYDLEAKITASSQCIYNPPRDIYDDDSTTFWHSEINNNAAKYPHNIKFEFESLVVLSGVRILPKQSSVRVGWVKDIEIQTSTDGNKWATVFKGSLDKNPEAWSVFKFTTTQAKFVNVIALSPQKAGDSNASFSEVQMIIKK